MKRLNIAALLLLAVCAKANATTYYVDANDGNNANPGTDAAKPWKTPKFISGEPGKPNMLVFSPDTWTGNLQLGGVHDLILQGTEKAPKITTLTAVKGNILSFSAGSKNIAIDSILFDSPFQVQVKNGFTYHASVVNFGNIKGENIKITKCELGHLSEGISVALATDVTVDSCTQTDPVGIEARFFMADDCTNLTFTNNTCTGSWNESPFRCTTNGIKTGLIAGNTFTQPLGANRTPYGNGMVKACVTIRAGTKITVKGNTCNNGALSINNDESTHKQTITNSTIEGNTVNNSFIECRAGSIGNTFTGNTVTAPVDPDTKKSALPGISINADPDSNNNIVNNTIFSSLGGVKAYTQKTGTTAQGNTVCSPDTKTPILDGDVVDKGNNTLKPSP